MIHAREDYNRIQDPAGIIPADEPVFLLRGQDRLAAETLAYYAQRAQEEGVEPELVSRTLAQAERMEAWPTHKTPDL